MNILASDIITQYIPRNFGREYYEINGSSQYPMFLATALGIKPVFDDWVHIGKYYDFVEACGKYGLEAVPDVLFTEAEPAKGKITGKESITTTYFNARPFSPDEKEGKVHVFVSRDRGKAIEAKKSGWYPVVINNRSTNKLYMDNIRFGRCLGFPPCCIDFFRKYNNWYFYSNPYETFKNTPAISGKARGSYYCNNFFMDNTYSLIHHLPCSYRCQNTINLAKRIEEKIKEVELDFVEKAMEMLKKPLLVFGERNFVVFDGAITKLDDDFHIDYEKCQYFQNPARPEDAIEFFGNIEEGNNIIMSKGKITIRDNNSALKTVEKKPEWFAIDFD